MYALQQHGQNDWYRIRNQGNGPAQLHIYDEIGYFGVSAADLIRDLANVEGALEVHINSPGGEVFDGIAIYNTLLARPNVTTVIDGIAASIASVIAMAGNPVLVARNGQMMIHEGHGMAIGNAQDMRDLAELLDKTSNNIASVYADHTGKPESYWRQKMKAETWYSGQEAIDEGLADRFIPSGAGRPVSSAPSDDWDMSIFRGSADLRSPRPAQPAQPGQPTQPPASPENAATVPYVNGTQSRHIPMTGTHRHDHAAQGATDHDDGMHSHTHTHNNDASHDHDGQHSGADYDGGKPPRSYDTYDKSGTDIRNEEPGGIVLRQEWTDEEVSQFMKNLKEVTN